MGKAVAQRIGAAVAVLFVVSLLTFAVLHLLPGDPATLVLGLEGSPDKVEALREAMGLNAPLFDQYVGWLGGMVQGDWGDSRVYGTPVLEVIGTALPVTLELSVYAMVLALLISLPLGVAAALRPGGFIDGIARVLTQLASAAPGFWLAVLLMLFFAGLISLPLGVAAALRPGGFIDGIARVLTQLASAAPGFWLAVLLMLFFAGTLGWFPVGGYTQFSTNPAECVRSLTLAAVALAVGECGILIRTVRSSVMTALGRDCMLSARVKGLSRWRSVVVYAVRGALVAPLTVAGLQLAKLVGGTVVVESVFALPGLGRLLLTAVEQRDLELVQGIVVVVTLAVVLVTLVIDLLVMAAQPSVRFAEGEETA